MAAATSGAVRVEFDNRRGQRLVGLLHGEPEGVAVISCHGMLSDKGGMKHQRLADELSARGLATLRFDFAGRGESQGSLYELSYSNEVEDLDAAIDFLARRGVERIGLFGSSMGGAVALLAASHDERVAAVATLAAVGHPAELAERYPEHVASWQERGYIETSAGRLGRGFFDDALERDVISAVRVLHIPLLVVHGSEDTVVSPSDALDIASAARRVALDMVEGADHRFSDPVHLRPTMQRVADFLSTALRDESRPF